MDTPGGLDTSMRAIIKDILASSVPVAAFVAPGGARAASAGTYILYASHIAAMAPATNLGAATPVAIGAPGGGDEDGKADGKGGKTGKGEGGGASSTMTRKQVNDASAYIRSLAQMRGRNAEWGERAVREAVSLSASEALKMKVIDLVAEDVPDLLKRLDGRKLKVSDAERVLKTADVVAITVEPDWRTRFLSVVTDPSIAYVLILLGIYALVFEFSNPGLVFPGVVGAICVLIALYAFHLLPVNYAGLALMLVGIAFMVGELFFPAYGSLGIGGAIAFVIGSVILIDTDVPGFGVPFSLVLGLAAGTAAFLFLVAGGAGGGQGGRGGEGAGMVRPHPGDPADGENGPAHRGARRSAAGCDLARQRLGESERRGVFPRRRSAEGGDPGGGFPQCDEPARADDAARRARQ